MYALRNKNTGIVLYEIQDFRICVTIVIERLSVFRQVAGTA